MATKVLNLSLKLSIDGNFNGLFNLNTTEDSTVGFDDTTAASQTTTITTGGATVIVASGVSDITYVYVKNTDPTNIVVLKTDSGTAYADVGPDEFAFIPVKGGVGIEAQAAGGDCVVEYATFKKV
tara:strand:+ start:174 stop:548 length:375 start_codon:yes stop_codon:yes gene_type:complete